MFKLISTLILIIILEVQAVEWHRRKLSHTLNAVTDNEITYLAGLSNESLFNQTLEPILIPRIPSTNGHDLVKKFIVDTMKALRWHVKLDSFLDQTPLGELRFTNIIATLNPKSTRHLVLACHYDSKMDREKVMTMATDSAVPCAMMINLATLLDTHLKQTIERADDVTLQFIFFDGEEAFETWSSTDSLYGSRHLARNLGNTQYPSNNREQTSLLNRMDVMVLLDLLGSPQPTFYNFFTETKDLFSRLVEIEKRLSVLNLLSNHNAPYFIDRLMFGGIEDDHIPFVQRGVRIVHLIPYPFPEVWHKDTDTLENLNFPTIDNLNKIVRVFVAEYLHLPLAIQNNL